MSGNFFYFLQCVIKHIFSPSADVTGTDDFDGACGYPGCRQVSSSRRDLAKHRRKMGHPKLRPANEDEWAEEMEEIEEDSPSKLLSSPSSSGARRALKYHCDSKDCNYVSRYRQNLDRHCRKLGHFAKIILETSKTRREDMERKMNEEEESAKDDVAVVTPPSPEKDVSGGRAEADPLVEGEGEEGRVILEDAEEAGGEGEGAQQAGGELVR